MNQGWTSMILGTETECIEFKKTTGELKEAMVSLASMLNKNGYGTLYFGIRDDGFIVGQQIGDRTLREISQAIANFIKPQVIPTISIEYLDDRNVVKVVVRGTERPYSAHGRYYMRSADEDRELTPGQLQTLMLSKVNVDSMIGIPSDYPNLSFEQLRTLYVVKGLYVNNDSFEDNLGLRTRDGEYNYMAQLLSDHNDVSIKVVTFKGMDKSNVIRRNEYGFKCLVLAMDQVLSYIESLNSTDVRIGSHQRLEQSLFDMASFREAWVNACLHNRWERKNPPAVYVFSDRIEIISTGGLPSDLTAQEFYKGTSKPSNPKLQKIFGQLGYVEQTGHGIPLIVRNYGMQAFDIMENFINVTIPFRRDMVRGSFSYSDSMRGSDARDVLCEIISENPSYTIRDMVRVSKYSDGYIRKLICELEKDGILEREGSRKTGRWKLKHSDFN